MPQTLGKIIRVVDDVVFIVIEVAGSGNQEM
jgi:hypothetical protein